MRRRRGDMLRSFGIGGTWTSAGFRAPGMWSMWEGGSTTVGFAQRVTAGAARVRDALAGCVG